MKNVLLSAALLLLLAAGDSCKSKKDNSAATTTETATPPPPPPAPAAPVEVAADESLRNGVRDATKDIKGLETRVENGVIYLSGAISKADNQRITPTLMSLKPQRIDREKLTVN